MAAILLALRSYRPALTGTTAEQLLLDTALRTPAGLAVDAAAAFRAAGLDGLVDAYQPPSPTPLQAADESFATGGMPGAVIDTVVAKPTIVEDGRPDRPKLRAASFKRRVVRVRVSQPPRGADAIFRIGHKSYMRPRGLLTLRARAWQPVSVVIEDRWGDRSAPLRIRRPTRR